MPQGLIAQGINLDCFNHDDRTDSLSPHYPLLDANCAVNRVLQNIEFLQKLLTVALHWVIYRLVFEISRVRICSRDRLYQVWFFLAAILGIFSFYISSYVFLLNLYKFVIHSQSTFQRQYLSISG